MFNKNILLSAAGRNEEEKIPFTLYAWGDNTSGKIGNGQAGYSYTSPVLTTLNSRGSPNQIGILTDWAKISCGMASSYAIKSNGTLWAWGDNSYGQLGTGDRIHKSSPVQVGANTNWRSISATVEHTFLFTLATKTDGTLWAWGSNYFGALGTGNTIATSSPVQVGTDTDWSTTISAGGHYYDPCSFAIKTNGTLWAWGTNTNGQLGMSDTITRSSPVQVGSDTDWLKIDASNAVLAIKSNGTLWAWGDNSYGQLGTGDTITRSSPVQVGTDADWVVISNKGESSYAIKSNGTLWSWGSNSDGQLGIGDTISRSSPVQVGTLTNWQNITSHSNYYSGIDSAFCVALKTNGTLWSWGGNREGQLGLNTTAATKSSPVQIGTSTNWNSISAGGENGHVLATFTSGKLYSWGHNQRGQLGYPTNGTAYVTIDVSASRSSPIQIGAALQWIEASYSGLSHAAAIKTNGTLWSWGANDNGQLGTGNTIPRSSPVQVGTLVNWARVSTGDYFSLATKTNGTLWSWGANDNGQLGTGNTIPRSSPVQVGTLNNWRSISAGSTAAAAIKSDGTLWMWGYNIGSQLGIGNTISTSSPVQVGTLNNWRSVSTGHNSTVAIKTDNTLWAWGTNENGELGLSMSNTVQSPIQVGTLTNWKYVSISSISNGSDHVVAIKTDGTLWSWGSNSDGQLGIGDTISRSSPVQVGTLTNWVYAIAGGLHSLAVKTDGTLWAWGRNIDGQLGTGNTISRSSPVQVGSLTNWIINTAGTNASAGGTS